MYRVDINGNNEVYGLKRRMFNPGEKVEFTVYYASDANTTVSSEDVELERGGTGFGMGTYSFIMPEKDVHVSIRTSGYDIMCLNKSEGFRDLNKCRTNRQIIF